MFTSHSVYRSIGFAFWAFVIIAAGYTAWPRSIEDASASSRARLRDFFLQTDQRINATDLSGRLQVGDPVFRQQVDGSWEQAGHIEAVGNETVEDSTEGGPKDDAVVIRWYAEADADSYEFVSHYNRGGLEDVIATMLPDDKRQQLQKRLSRVLRQHGEEMTKAFTPLVEDSLRRSIPIIELEVRRSVERHRDDVDALARRWNDDVVSERLIPMARREILPIVREHGEPTAERIGRELWDRASLWRFGWRIVYDRSPLPERNLVQEEWDRFVEEEAVPVFERHMDEIVVSVQKVLSDVAANNAVRRELGEVADELSRDPKARRFVRTILRESLLQNETLKNVWREVWTSAEARAAMTMASDRLEPVVRGIGDDLFGTQEEGIDPNFARVLRNQILGKDRRWIVARPKSDATAPQDTQSPDRADNVEIRSTSEFMPYPLVYMADRDSEEAGGQ